MYSVRVDAKSYIESLYDEFGIKSPTQKVMLTKSTSASKKKVGKKNHESNKVKGHKTKGKVKGK